MKIWITGIAGFLGHYLAERLIDLGHDVDGNDSIVCNSFKISALRKIDCANNNAMRIFVSKHETDILFHCAATAHEGLSTFSPSFITKNIYEASVSTFSAAIASGVKRIVYMSSMSRYGDGTPPFFEYHCTRPVDPYGIAKVAAEETLKVLCKTHGVEYVIAVPHNIIGPGQRYVDPYRNVASIMINRALQGKPIIIYGDGQQERCFSPIDDCLDSIVKMMYEDVNGETINIGPDEGTMTILELAEKILKITHSKAGIIHVDGRPNEVKSAYCSSTKARLKLGYRPQKNIDECLSEMAEYIRIHGTKPFEYSFPIEIMNEKTPKTWTEQLI